MSDLLRLSLCNSPFSKSDSCPQAQFTSDQLVSLFSVVSAESLNPFIADDFELSFWVIWNTSENMLIF